MITMPVGEFKARFSEVLKQVEKGDEVIISYGKGHRNVAALVPVSKLKQTSNKRRRIGILKDRGSFYIAPDFTITEEEFLQG
jgi:prevent-host-death family protein